MSLDVTVWTSHTASTTFSVTWPGTETTLQAAMVQIMRFGVYDSSGAYHYPPNSIIRVRVTP